MELLIIALLILLNGIFSMSEIALVSSRKFKLESAARKGNKGAKKALHLAQSPNTFLSTVQVGITLIGILTGIFSGQKLTSDIAAWFSSIPLLAGHAESLAVITVVILITYATIVFGELIPKRLGMSAPERVSAIVALPMSVLSAIARPLIWLLAKTTDFFFTLFGVREKQDGIVTEEEIKEIVRQSAEGGEIEEIEQDMVRRVFSLGDRRAGELMTHRNSLIWIEQSESAVSIQEKVNAHPYSVYPVCDQSPENLLGMVSLKQLFRHLSAADTAFRISDLLDTPLYVPENMAAYRVLEQFRTHGKHHAMVVDEYGSIEGMITMNDVMEELIGEVMEENPDEYQIIARDDGSWLVDGQFPYFELLEFLGVPDDRQVSGFTTVGGLFIFLANRIPQTGEKITWNGYELEVVDMDGQRIDKVLITALSDD